MMVFACPVCRGPLFQQEARMVCPHEANVFVQEGGVWRFLRPDRQAHFEQFITEYEVVRQKEGRGSKEPEGAAFYRALPFRDLTGRFADDWKIRAKSFTMLLKRVIDPAEKKQRGLQILDLGAGNGWLSARLAARGHEVLAVDLLTNTFDGLGAYTYYEHTFTPIQAEFQFLPLVDEQADVVIFNASLHYAENYEMTLREARRVLKPEGEVVILDSPVYHNPESGRQMALEREAFFQKNYGFKSNSIASEHFLTFARLADLEREVGLKWKTFTPFYGLKWLLKPLRAKLRGRREPAKFMLIVGRAQR